MFTDVHTHIETQTSAGHHHHSGNNTRDGYHKGKLWAPRPSWEDDLAGPEQWTVGIRLSCIDLPPMASPARLSERRTDKKTHNIFLSLSPAPSRCLSFLAVRRAPTDQRGWAESWTTCWQELLNSPQWHIVREKRRKRQRLLFIHICHTSIESQRILSPLLLFFLGHCKVFFLIIESKQI